MPGICFNKEYSICDYEFKDISSVICSIVCLVKFIFPLYLSF